MVDGALCYGALEIVGLLFLLLLLFYRSDMVLGFERSKVEVKFKVQQFGVGSNFMNVF